jgi:hypothetical protein
MYFSEEKVDAVPSPKTVVRRTLLETVSLSLLANLGPTWVWRLARETGAEIDLEVEVDFGRPPLVGLFMPLF